MIKRSCLCVALMLALSATSPVLAQAEVRHAVELQPQDLGTALKLLAQQTKLQIVYPAELVQGKRAPAISGSLTASDALSQLLRGTGLEYELLDSQTVTLLPKGESRLERPGDVDGAGGSRAGDGTGGESAAVRPSMQAGRDRVQPSPAGVGTAHDLDSITVTGTRIRGGITPSPVVTIDTGRIKEEGFADLGEVIRSIPQNFSGGQNPGVAAGATTGPAGIANQNITGGSSLNLRGLGPDASLTLLNGRRLSYGGIAQTVDISAIPVAAVDRIEIVPDGASAIYGSDAVGGVGNVILRRDYTGAALGMLHGRATDGGLETREYTATSGAAWSSGGLIATYKHASVDPIQARQRDYTAHMPLPTTIYPGSQLRSGLVSAHQSLGDMVELRLDALQTEREQISYSYYSGVGSYYSRFEPETRTTLVAPAVEVSLANDWQLSVSAAWGRDRRVQLEWRNMLATGETLPSPFDDCFCNESRTYELGAEGPLFALPGGDVRLAAGAGYRQNEFVNYRIASGQILIPRGRDGSRFAYAELGMPLIGSASTADDGQRLVLTAAVRGEDYDSFGSVATPKLGLLYGPTGDYTLKASWGRSFKAPTLLQRFMFRDVILDEGHRYGAAGAGSSILAVFGGDPDLQPERARTWTASLALHPQALAAFEAELTWFDIDYTDRVVQPIGNYAEALTNPAYARYIQWSPTAAEQAQVLDSAARFANYTGAAHDPENVSAVIYAHFVNVARQRIRGIDLSASYGFDVGAGRLTLRGSGSWLDSTQQTGAEASAFDLAGTLYSPAKVNTRAGLVWLRGGFTASAFGNYTSGVTDSATGFRTASFTTADLTLRYSVDADAGSRAGWDFALSAQNLFDRAPPLHPTTDPTWVPYDSTNYSAIGRYLSFSVSKRF